MFKWRKHDKYEPKTPKLSSISLPDDRYTPLLFQPSYSERPPSNLLLQREPSDMRTTNARYDSRQGHRDSQSGYSRSRTISTPARSVEAPRPIRPHPSQGPFNPVLENSHRIRIEPFRGPVSVPSAQYLEEQIRNNPIDPAILPPSTVHRMLHGPEYEYPEERKLKELAKKGGIRVSRQLSKAYLEEMEDQKREAERLKAPSAPPMKKAPSKGVVQGKDKKDHLVDFDDWKPVPVTTTPPRPTTILEPEQKALKSALKKTPSTRTPSAAAVTEGRPAAPAIKSALRNGRVPEPNAYYSENETSRRRKDSETVRRKTLGDYLKPIKVATTPSKAWLEQEQERLEAAREKEMQRGGSSHGHQPSQPQARPVYGAAAFAPTNSSTTPSPTEANEYHRTRRSSLGYQEPQHVHSSYMPAYIKEDFLRTHHQIMTWETDPPIHANLTWPLIDYATRKRAPEPLIYFDAGFNPRNSKYPVKAKRGLHWSPLTRDEETMFVSLGAYISNMIVVNKKLEAWPIHIKMSHNIRVIDVFRMIYDTYSQPLTERELRDCGSEYIQRCERAFLQRCEDGPDFAHNEQRKGMLRIDLLRGRRVFKGLVPMPGRPHTFELLFDDT